MTCNVCGLDNWTLRRLTARCQNCGFVRALDRFYDTATSDVYSDSYYSGTDYYNYEEEYPALRRNFLNRLSLIQKFVTSGKLLEVGCAYGYFLKVLSKSFDVTGIEVNPKTAHSAREKTRSPVLVGDFLEIEFARERFDVVVAIDTIEHVARPKDFIAKCAQLLPPKGYLFLETGDVEAMLPRLRQEKWRLIHPPEHLSYLSIATIRRCFEESKMEYVTHYRVPFWRTLNQIFYRSLPTLHKKLPQWLKRTIGRIAIPINTYDLIFVVGRKIGN